MAKKPTKLSDLIRKSGSAIKQAVRDSGDYFGNLIKAVEGDKRTQKQFTDAYKRFGGLLDRDLDKTVNATTYINRNRKNAVNKLNNMHIGRLVMFKYNAKTQDQLPYWDRMPLILPVEYYGNNRMLGINFHYLPPKLRAVLLDQLIDNEFRHRYDEKRRLNFNYNVLKRASTNKLFLPCVKKYIISPENGYGVQSPFIIIPPDEYKFALFLPYEMFQKKSRTFVWADSVKKAGL